MNSIFNGLFIKTLKGVPGHSFLDIDKIDVSLIRDIHYRKRLFRILNFNKPYTLTIEYSLPQNTLSPIPILNLNGTVGSFIFINSTEYERLITKRYATEEEVKSEINEIKELQNKIEKLKENLKKDLLEKLINDKKLV